MSREVFVDCNVFEGMFSDEAVVELADASYIVPKHEVVETAGEKGKVKATLLTRSDGEWVVLPTSYSDTIPSDKVTISKIRA